VGDSVSHFEPGDLVLVGSYLPHLWRNDPSYYQDNDNAHVKTIIIKFTLDFLGEDTFKNPVFSNISNLFEESNYGISFGKSVSDSLSKEIIELVDMTATEKTIKLLDIFHRLSKAEDKTILSSTDMRQYSQETSHRIANVLKFISDNYSGDINLKDVSDIACMTTNSFCRYFKKMTNKSFIDFLNEIRIRNAGRLLAQDANLNISEVCYTVGYKSITNFNHQFKIIMGTNPKNYRDSVTGMHANVSLLAEVG
jgi:YesN/AraC family two-component response regulator